MTFQSRALRIAAEFPISFLADTAEGSEVQGNCINISESGLLGEFAEALELWTEGEILLRFGGGALGVRVRVVRVTGNQAGLTFRFRNDEQRQTISQAVASAFLEMKRKGHNMAMPF